MPLTLLKPSEVAERLQISERQVYKLVHRGDLKGIRIGNGRGNTIRIDAASLDALIEAGRIDAHS